MKTVRTAVFGQTTLNYLVKMDFAGTYVFVCLLIGSVLPIFNRFRMKRLFVQNAAY